MAGVVPQTSGSALNFNLEAVNPTVHNASEVLCFIKDVPASRFVEVFEVAGNFNLVLEFEQRPPRMIEKLNKLLPSMPTLPSAILLGIDIAAQRI